jgi:hypothetical protein
MSDRVNLVRVLTASTGTATMTLGAAYSALFMTSAEAGMVNGRTYTYLIAEGNDWELGKGVYTTSGTTLSRVTVLASRISGTLGTTKITLSGTAQVRIVESADDMGALRGTRVVTGTTDALAQSDLGGAVTYSNAVAIAVSIAQAGASGAFLDGWSVHVKNTGAGTLTITPTTSTINSAATLVLPTNMGAFIWSDGTNYQAHVFGVNVNGLTADTAPDLAADYVLTYDASASSNKKVFPKDLSKSFAAHKNGTNQTGIANVTDTLVTFGTATFNVGSMLNTGTSRVTPPAGRVQLQAQLNYSGTFAVGNLAQCSIFKNGSLFKAGFIYATRANLAVATVAIIDEANGTDYYEVFAYIQVDSGTATVNGNALYTFFSASTL